ncbi:MAG TPA: 2Fe-2S iron-sulfur cluster-binding protein [Saprospiraceae bacterium]|nr:2Fe-2S iron-sulfur cluster-binding protein [Saprospiraceae bacterium]
MSRYTALKITRIQRETPESVSVWLEVPEELKSQFSFRPGQYLPCRATLDGEEIRKSYSICSVPDDTHLAIAVKEVYGGRFSTYVNQQLKPGDLFEVMIPEGKFILPENMKEDAELIFFAAGSGITPIISLIKYFLSHYPKGQAKLFYNNKTSDTIIFKDELEGLKNVYMNRFSVYHLLTREISGSDLMSGRIDAEKLIAFSKHLFDIKEIDSVFICGPEHMILNLKDGLLKLGLKEEQIRFELFGTAPVVEFQDKKIKPLDAGDDRVSKVTYRIDGHETDLQVRYHGEAVLDAALQSGFELPYSCKGGVCSTCKALVVEGKVHMDIHYGLEPDEIDAGYVLTCQSHPRSERLILDYDIQ